MFTNIRRRLTELRGVEFCDECAEVCTAQCRADAHLERARAKAAYQFLFPR